jgi:hypothetical protein
MPANRILLIAPESDLVHSLRFALEVEHYDVTWRASIGARVMPDNYDCTVVDHHGLGTDVAAAKRFLSVFEPVVLLANQTHELSPFAFKTIVKPGLGAPFMDAVREAVSHSTAATK